MLLLYLSGADLLNDPADEFARWTAYTGCLLFLAGAMLASVTWRREMRTHALARAAPGILGRVASVKKDWLSQTYVLYYSFKDAVGRAYRGKKFLSQQEAFTWREGEEGEVRYDPKDPKISSWIGRAVAFDAEGDSATAPATIIEVKKESAENGDEILVRYRYCDHLGETHEDQFIEDEGAHYKVGETGTVEFDPRYAGTSAWLGKSGAVAAPETAEAMTPTPRVVAPVLARAARPSTFQLIKRCKPFKNAMLILVYIFIAAVFLLLLVAFPEPSSTDYRAGVALYSVGLLGLVAWFALNVRKGVRQVKGWRRIADRGLAAEGTVNLVEEKRQSLGRWTWKPGWVISYRYHDHEGKPHTGESGYLSRRAADRWRSGDKCVVVYDPARPSNSVWIGKA